MPLASFGFGYSRQRARSDSSSSAMSVGGSSSQSLDRVFNSDIFSELFGNASLAAGGINGDQLGNTANRLFDSGMGFLDELATLSGGGNAGTGEEFLAGELGRGDELLGEQIDALQADLGEFFGETVLPGIRGDAIAAGGLGGSRQGVAEGIAGRGLLREFGRGALGLRENAQARRTAIAETLAGLQTQRRLAATGTGLSALPAQFGLAEAGSMAALSPFMALAQILGSPTVLGESSAEGFEYSTAESRSSSRSRGDAIQLQAGLG